MKPLIFHRITSSHSIMKLNMGQKLFFFFHIFITRLNFMLMMMFCEKLINIQLFNELCTSEKFPRELKLDTRLNAECWLLKWRLKLCDGLIRMWFMLNCACAAHTVTIIKIFLPPSSYLILLIQFWCEFNCFISSVQNLLWQPWVRYLTA